MDSQRVLYSSVDNKIEMKFWKSFFTYVGYAETRRVVVTFIIKKGVLKNPGTKYDAILNAKVVMNTCATGVSRKIRYQDDVLVELTRP